MATRVSLIPCSSYEQSEVDSTIHQSLEALGGIAQFVKPGQNVLIKPNCLMSKSPAEAVTTHPAIISAVVKEVIKAGGIAWVGDSPGNAFGNIEQTMVVTGIKQATEAAGGQMVYFERSGLVTVNGIKIAKVVTEADVIINLPKLKTHNLTLYTGAIKNMFGIIPGFYKAQFHFAAPHPHDFAKRLVAIFAAAKPALNIMDAVIGMEGAGPSAGKPRKFGAIIASTDAVALDAICAYLIGFDPAEIEMINEAHRQTLGEIRNDKIEVIGEKLAAIRQANWEKPSNLYNLTKHLPGIFHALFRPLLNQFKIYPAINPAICTRCEICLKSCPAKTIKTHPPSPSLIKRGGGKFDASGGELFIELDKCIMCYCCHELCPERAITLKRTWLAKLLGF